MPKTPPRETDPDASTARFQAQVEPYLMPLWQAAYHFTGHREDAEDLLQELLARLYPQREKLTAVEELRPWLLRSLYHLFIDRRRQWLRNVLSSSDTGTGGEGVLEAVPSEASGPEDAATADNLRRTVHRALAVLDPDQRAVVVLHDMQGYTLAELQEQLQVPIGTLKSRLFRGRGRLRPLLGNLLPNSDVLIR